MIKNGSKALGEEVLGTIYSKIYIEIFPTIFVVLGAVQIRTVGTTGLVLYVTVLAIQKSSDHPRILVKIVLVLEYV